MSRIEELASEQFHRWQSRGCGARLFSESVALEPTFVPFSLSIPRVDADEGRRHTRLSGLLQRLSDLAQPPASPPPPEPDADPKPFLREPEEMVEVALTAADARKPHQMEPFLRQVSRQGETVAFELLATSKEIVPQFAATRPAADRVERSVAAYLPGVDALAAEDSIFAAWLDGAESAAILELHLGREFVVPLGEPRCDLLAGLVTALSGLAENEVGLLQVLFEPTINAWAESMVSSVSDEGMMPLFANRADLPPAVQRKTASPLFAVVVRLAAKAEEIERAWEILADMAAPFSALDRRGSNFFVPSSNEGYPDEIHEWDLLNRLSRRNGMLLSMEELVPLVTPPSPSASLKLRRQTRRTHAAPESLLSGSLHLGGNVHAGRAREVCLSREQRVRHAHVIGATGTGKSTLLLHLIRQDIEAGEGIAVFDPHGDLIESVIGMIPPERVGDVVIVDPSDEESVVGLNVLTAHSDLERNLLASDLTSVFRRLSTSWGDQMESVLRNAILAFLESSRGGSLVELRRFLIDPGFRKEFLPTVTDPEVVYYWTHAFPLLGAGKSIGPLLTRLDEFLSRKPIRCMMSAKAVDFSEVIDSGKIFLAKLPQGLIGRQNAYLLGSLLVSKFQQAIMARQRQAAADRRDFWMYLDEFHHFITPSVTEILSGARKYGAGLVLAHQELRQLKADAEVESAVLANCQTRVVFRTSDADANALAEGFSSFGSDDIQSLEIGQAICRVERRDHDFNLTVPHGALAQNAAAARDAVLASSRKRYGTPRAEVETELLRNLQASPPAAPPVAEAAEQPEVLPPAKETFPQPAAEKHLPPVPRAADAEARPLQPAASIAAAKVSGKGGERHKHLQHLIKLWAQERGWLATVESPVKGGMVDVCLIRGERKIACEISVTTASEHETANVLKCLNAGFDFVALVVEKARRVSGLEKVLRAAIPEPDFARVRVFTVEALCAFLDELDAQDASRSGTVRGYAVKVTHRVVDPGVRAQRIAALTKVVAESLREMRES